MLEYTTEALLIQQARACFLEHVFNTFQANEARGREVTGNDRAAAVVADFLAASVEQRSRSKAALHNIVEFPHEHSGLPRSA